MAALIAGRLDSQWITDTRRWTLVSFLFLTVGLILGMVWAYEEIGWGFWWMWIPSKTLGLSPGLRRPHSALSDSGTAWHVQAMEHDSRMPDLLLDDFRDIPDPESADRQYHAFADSTLAEYFIWYLAVLALVSTILIGWRWRALRAKTKSNRFGVVSFFVLNNLFLVSCAFIVLFGTLIPKITESETVRAGTTKWPTSWDERPWNNRSAWMKRGSTTLWHDRITLLLLAGAGPLISWRRDSDQFRRTLRYPCVVPWSSRPLGPSLGFFKIDEIAVGRDTTFSEAYSLWAQALGVTDYYVVFAYFTCIFVTWTIVREFHLGAMIRKGSQATPLEYDSSDDESPRRYGGYIVHLGIVFMFVAFTGKFFKTQEEKTVSPGVVAAEDYD